MVVKYDFTQCFEEHGLFMAYTYKVMTLREKSCNTTCSYYKKIEIISRTAIFKNHLALPAVQRCSVKM